MKKILFFAILILFVSSIFAQPDPIQQAIARLDEQSKVFASVAYKVTPAVVHVSVTKKVATRDPMQDFFGDEFFRRFFEDNPRFRSPNPDQEGTPQQRGLGSGMIVDATRGYILSNNHVVKDADEVIVKLADRREFKAKVIGADEKTDIAVIQIDAPNLVQAPLGNSDDVMVGQWVLAIGNPFGLTQTVTAGIISAKGRANVGIVEYEDFIQTDAAINPGNSGGPLVNLRGEIIGVNTAIASQTGGNMGIGFAVPINMARNIMEQLISNGKVRRGWLGVRLQEVTPEIAQAFKLRQNQGVLISEIIKDSPADRAGLKEGDVIIAFDGSAAITIHQLRNQVATTPIGKRIRLEIIRDGRNISLDIVLGDLEKAQQSLESEDIDIEGQSEVLEDLGIVLREITPELVSQYRLRIKSGVVITEVKPNSIARRQGISEGSVIQQINQINIRNLSDVRAALQKESSYIILRLATRFGSQFLVLPRGK